MKHKKNVVIPKLEPGRMRGREIRTEICKRCGREWAVSKHAAIEWGGYICPQCEKRGKS